MRYDPDDTGVIEAGVGRRLALTRRAFGFTQGEFADPAGMSQPQYSQFEVGKRLLTLPYALQLCDQYGLSLDWLYRGDPSALAFSLVQKLRELRDAKR